MKHARHLSFLILAACGGGSSDPDAVVCSPTGRYLELAAGRSWSYRVTDAMAATSPKTQTVSAEEDVGGMKAGVIAWKLTTTKPGGMTVSWQEDTGDAVIRHRELDQAGANQTEEYYLPSKLRIDETTAHTVTGAAWSVTYDEIVSLNGAPPVTVTKTESWDIVGVDVPVVVPAGTYCTLQVHRTSMVGTTVGSDKTYWFARGVGKVKEQGDRQIEELVSFTP